MATTKEKIKEANFVDEQVAQEQAQPASSVDMVNAQAQPQAQAPVAEQAPVEDVPVEEVPVEEQPVEEEPVEEVPAEGEPQVTIDGDEVEIPATIEIKTQDLGASVAMVTGDTEPAELSADVAQSEPLVQDEGEVPAEGAPVEEPVNDNPEIENLEDDDVKLESLSREEQDVIREYRKYKEENEVNSAKAAEEAMKEEPIATESTEEQGKGSGEPAGIADKFADEAEKAAKDSKPEHKDIKVSIKESEEDLPEEPIEDMVEDSIEDEQEPVDLDMLAGIPDVNAEDDVMLDAFNEDPEGMSLGSIGTFLKGVESAAEDKVADVSNEIENATSQMQKSIDYLKSLLDGTAIVDEVPEEVVDNVELPEPSEDLVEEIPDEFEEVEESCKKSIKESKERKLKEDYGWEIQYDKTWEAYDYLLEVLGGEELACSLAQAMGDNQLRDLMAYICRMNDLEDCPYLEGAEDEDEEDEDEDYEDDDEGLSQEEAYRAYTERVKRIPVSSGRKNPFLKDRKPVERTLKPRVQESYEDEVKQASANIKYPAGSKPIGTEEDNIVKTYEESARRKREALANFREAMRTSKKTEERQLDEKFVEALHTPSKMNVTCEDKKSWSNNRIDESQEKLSFNNLKRMLENGFLG